MKERRRHPVAAGRGKDYRVERGIRFEAPIKGFAEAVVPVEFIDQFEQHAGAEPMDLLGEPLTMQAPLRLRSGDVLDYRELTLRRQARVEPRPVRFPTYRARCF